MVGNRPGFQGRRLWKMWKMWITFVDTFFGNRRNVEIS